MNKLSPLTEWQIAKKISAQKEFRVLTNKERKLALSAAKFANLRIFTRAASGAEGFNVYFSK